MSALRRIPASPSSWACCGIIALGAVLRFSTLDLQSYRYDEAVTIVRVLHPSLLGTVEAVGHSESTPPLYYMVAWLWSRLLGTGEFWLRSLSALSGTASILVVYLGARALPLPRRAGLLAAAVVAVSPVLVWFSQDARAYALTFLLSSLSFLFFARARRSGSRRDLAWWALFSALAIATHYFAGFLVAPEAALLLLGINRRGALAATLAPLAVLAALTPILLEQTEHDHASWIGWQPLGQRLERAGAKLLGADNGDEHGALQTGPVPVAVPAALAVAAMALLLSLGDAEERRGAGVTAIVGGTAVAVPLLLALLGSDYLDGRNLLPAFAPLTIVLGAGFAVRRAGWAGLGLGAALCVCSLAFTIAIDRVPRLQREDLRNAAAQVGGTLGPQTALVTNRYAASQPLLYYLGARVAHRTPAPLTEIDLVGSASAARSAGRLLPPSFHRVESKPVSYDFTLTRLRSARPVTVPLRVLERGALVGGGHLASVLIAPSAAPVRAR